MNVGMIKYVLGTSALALLAACSAEPQASAPAGLEISLRAVFEPGDACRIERVARYDQSTRPLYMVRGEGTYSLTDGQRKRIPVQIQFRVEQGIAEDTSITLTDFPVPCSEVAIEWVLEECEAADRSIVKCPAIQLIGEDAFRAVDIQMSE